MIFTAFGAVLNGTYKARVSATVFEEIKGAVTEKAVLPIYSVAWIVFAICVRKKLVTQMCLPIKAL